MENIVNRILTITLLVAISFTFIKIPSVESNATAYDYSMLEQLNTYNSVDEYSETSEVDNIFNADYVLSVSSISEFSSSVGVANKLTSDISGSLMLEGQTYIIDLAGHKWTNSSNAIVLATGSLYVYDSVGGGSIVTTSNDAINMGNGVARFENITITGGGDNMDAIYCNGGELTVENCILSAPKAGINIANESEAIDANARAVVSVNGGKFAKYIGAGDSMGRNCAIEIKNNADEITLTGNIEFENNLIISKASNVKSIENSITADATFTIGNNIGDYVTATINYNTTSGDLPDNPNGVIAGDLNSDTIVDAKDVTVLRRYYASGWDVGDGAEFNEALVNINYPDDDIVDAKDISTLRRFITSGWDIEIQVPNGNNTDASVVEVSNINGFVFNTGVVNKLTTNISGGVTLSGRSLVVDLNGHTWNNVDHAIVLDAGYIYVYDSVGGGSVEASTKDAVNMSNGVAKFENITITAGGDTMDAIFCNGGNLTVINCILSAPKAGINIANASEDYESSARAVVTVIGGKFANYYGTKDSQGRNCAIEIKNNADEITLSGNIIFENNLIISRMENIKSIKEAITVNATYVTGNYISNYLTAFITMGNGEAPDDNDMPNVNLEELAEKVVIPDNIVVDFTDYLFANNSYQTVSGLMAFKKNMLCTFNEKISYPLDIKITELNGVLFVDAENFVKTFNLNYRNVDKNSAVIFANNMVITLNADSSLINVNGTDYDFVTTLYYNGTFLISIEDFIKAMGYQIAYDASSEIYYFYYYVSDYSEANKIMVEDNIKKYQEIIYNYDDVECDQTGVGLYEKSKYEDRKVGLAYTTWNRTNFPWSGSSWSYPLLGKYASNDKEVVRQHGIWLADAGVDFVFVDWSNNTGYHPNLTGVTREDFEMIESATDVLFEVWSEIPNAPKICILAGPGHSGIESVNNGNHQRKVDQIYNSYINNEKNKDMYFHYEGKPLLMCYGATPTQYGTNPTWSDDRFTIRWVTGYVGQQGSLYNKQTLCSNRYWSWEERGAQTYTVKDGIVEAVTCSAATRAQNSPGQSGYIPACGRENGATLKKQFQRAIDLGSSFVLLVSWNEWTVGEQPSPEYSKDLEPSEAHGTFYYDLMRELIKKYKGKI